MEAIHTEGGGEVWYILEALLVHELETEVLNTHYVNFVTIWAPPPVCLTLCLPDTLTNDEISWVFPLHFCMLQAIKTGGG